MSMRLDIITNDAGDLVRREHARDLGAGVVVSIYRLAKLVQMHDLTNQAFLRQLEHTTQSVHDYCLRAGSNVNILFAQKAVFVAGQLLKGSRMVYEQAIELGEILEWCGGSELVIMRDVTAPEMQAFAEALSQSLRGERGRFYSPSPRIRLRSVDDKARLRGLELENLTAEQRIVRTYASAVVIMRRFFEDLQASRYVLPRRIKRIAQSLVDLSEGTKASFLGVTEARNANHDDAGRAVNTAILAVSMARELTLDRATLAQIAMAAMMHDVGRPRAMSSAAVPGMPQMPGVMSLSEDQEDRLPSGTAAVLTALGRVNEPSVTRTVVAFESLWLRRQKWIGPVYRGVRPPTMHAKIVAISRRYNDLMTPEPGLPPPTSDFAVATMSEELKESADKTVLRMLVAALGLIPVGTVVQLSTSEVCEVIPRGEPGPPDRPRLRIVLDAQGGVVTGSVEIDLARESSRRITRIMSIDGWRKGLETRSEPEAPPPSAQSGSGLRPAEPSSPSSPSRSAVSPSRSSSRPSPSSPAGASQALRKDGSAPSMSSISSAASLSSLGSSPSAVAEAMGKMINETMKQPVAIAAVEVRAMPQVAEEGRTLLQVSPFGSAQKDRSSGPRIAAAEPVMALEPEGQRASEPTARGSLDATPLAHVLVYMLDHALSGSVVFEASEGDHVVYFLNGVPAKVRLASPDYLIGTELVSMGALDAARLDDIADGAEELGLLFGEYSVGLGLVTRDVLARALEQQLIRRIASLANLPPGTSYSYFRDVNQLEGWGGGELTVTGPLNPILASVRAWSDRSRVQATLGKIGKHALVFHEDADLENLRPTEAEQAVVDAIVTRECTLPALAEMGVADADAVSSVVYALAVTRQFAFKNQKKGPMAARPRPSQADMLAPAPTSLAAFRPSFGVGAAASNRPASVSAMPAVVIPPPAPPVVVHPAEPDVVVEVSDEDDSDLREREPSGERPDDHEEEEEEGEGDADLGDLTPEMAEAERALEAMTNFRLAETALQRGDMAQAELLAKKAAEGDPEQAEYVALHAWIHAMGGGSAHVLEAIVTITRVLADDPTCDRALLYRGKLNKRANKTKDALRDFEAVLKINPKHREAASEVRLLKMHVK